MLCVRPRPCGLTRPNASADRAEIANFDARLPLPQSDLVRSNVLSLEAAQLRGGRIEGDALPSRMRQHPDATASLTRYIARRNAEGSVTLLTLRGAALGARVNVLDFFRELPQQDIGPFARIVKGFFRLSPMLRLRLSIRAFVGA